MMGQFLTIVANIQQLEAEICKVTEQVLKAYSDTLDLLVPLSLKSFPYGNYLSIATLLSELGDGHAASLLPAVAGTQGVWLWEGGCREHEVPDGMTAATVRQPVKVDNELYVRDYGKCILCYKCVDACGDQWQNSFAITVAGRGFDARISTEFANPLPDSACVYCGNCVEVCPTGALSFKAEHDRRENGTWDEDRQTATTTICTFCGVGCNLTLHVQDNEIVKVTSPHDSSVTHGNLCIKGRFGFQHVQNR